MADALWMRIREVEWEQYPTSDGSNMPSLLRNLGSRKLPRAMKASHQMWTALCGGGELYPAAIRCVPFLLEILAISDPGVQEGILDIFNRIATEGEKERAVLQQECTYLQRYTRSKDISVAEKTQQLVESLKA